MRTNVRLGLLVGMLAAAGALAAGCGKKQRYAPTCQKAAELTAPWTEMNLPVSEGRVCKSEAKRLEVEFLKGTREERFAAFEAAVQAAGFEKKECKDNRCVYVKDGQRLNVMGMSTERWRTIVMWL
jgi:hypothetical protein